MTAPAVATQARGAGRPRLLDLFCCQGGAAMGYNRAGFDVVGVDILPQPRYPFEFHQADALEYVRDHGHKFDAIHASPPCQAYSVAGNIWGHEHPMLIGQVRKALMATGKLYVIENVPGAPLVNPAVLCGRWFGLNVKRHRLFESNVMIWSTPCPHGHPGDWLLVFGECVLDRSKSIGKTAKGGPRFKRKHVGIKRGQAAMGIDWMTLAGLSEAVPPAYTEFIGAHLLAVLAPAEPGRE